MKGKGKLGSKVTCSASGDASDDKSFRVAAAEDKRHPRREGGRRAQSRQEIQCEKSHKVRWQGHAPGWIRGSWNSWGLVGPSEAVEPIPRVQDKGDNGSQEPGAAFPRAINTLGLPTVGRGPRGTRKHQELLELGSGLQVCSSFPLHHPCEPIREGWELVPRPREPFPASELQQEPPGERAWLCLGILPLLRIRGCPFPQIQQSLGAAGSGQLLL